MNVFEERRAAVVLGVTLLCLLLTVALALAPYWEARAQCAEQARQLDQREWRITQYVGCEIQVNGQWYPADMINPRLEP